MNTIQDIIAELTSPGLKKYTLSGVAAKLFAGVIKQYMVDHERLLAILNPAHEKFCPFITTCDGKYPEGEHGEEYCPCSEHGAPCWYYSEIYLPMKRAGFVAKKEATF